MDNNQEFYHLDSSLTDMAKEVLSYILSKEHRFYLPLHCVWIIGNASKGYIIQGSEKIIRESYLSLGLFKQSWQSSL